MQKYNVPFDVENFEPHLTRRALDEMAQHHGATVNYDDEVITGTADGLADFFQTLDGPAQSFSNSEFLEYIQQFKLV